ncbi:flagellar motor protein MotA [Shewanella psychropiezotolerans]|uniref:Flagellar motor protein MotA n=1 Tax=Shewanella psychropiezotolerans TaxID=2593655 RepID=A0ABX5X5G2_9GAMM|nr:MULTISPECIES: MotA/TolQ/ExbB proton channel family protein [Shewanella]MPY23600.1 flagellar motor protein MotA [Shewanella sp. YLB-07]QDO85657.1 flagellar motor protein MotA [Shewanella psychropiezotolerans]
MSVNLFTSLSEQLGPLTWPMFICAFIALMIILERLALVIFELPKRDTWLRGLRKQSRTSDPEQVKALIAQLSTGRSMLSKGTHLLLTHAEQNRTMREEIINLWLTKQKQVLRSGLKVLQVIGIITPLLGLLGTVLGLIEMFNQLGASDGPVTPSQLASGLGLAMNTTAAGLIIAVPAITMAHLFGIWADQRCSKIAYVLNQINLWLEGLEQAMTLGCDPQASAFCTQANNARASNTQSKKSQATNSLTNETQTDEAQVGI